MRKSYFLKLAVLFSFFYSAAGITGLNAEVRPKKAASEVHPNWAEDPLPKRTDLESKQLQKEFTWWPTDSRPGPFKDPNRNGYWWWPEIPGKVRPWGNRGFIYVLKIIYDYKNTEGDIKPSLIVKRILKNVKIYFNYDKDFIREDAGDVLAKALVTLRNNPKADILVTGNADVRGSESYNFNLAERRAASVKKFLMEKGLDESRIRILSRGKMDAMAPTNDLVGMQKDRNAHFMVAEVEEVMIPASQAKYFQEQPKEEEKVENIESEIHVSVKDYVIQETDSLWNIAEREYGNGRQWKRIYEFNKEKIPNPNRLRKGTKIKIPIE